MTAPLPRDEAERVARAAALARPEPALDALLHDVVRLAARLCDAPMAAVSLVDAGWQRVRAGVGTEGFEAVPRERSFCGHAIGASGLTEVADARADARFADHPLVAGPAGVRAYAGVPLALPGMAAPGTLCVLDTRARRLDAAQRAALEDLARIVARAIQVQPAAPPGASALAVLLDLLPTHVVVWDREFRNLYTNAPARRFMLPGGDDPTGRTLRELFGDAVADENASRLGAALGGETIEFDTLIDLPEHGPRNHTARIGPLRDAGGAITGVYALVDDTTDHMLAQHARDAVEASERKFRTLSDSSPLGVFHTDAQGLCTYTNPRWQEIYGISLADSLGEGWSRGVHPDDRDALLARWRETAERGGEFSMRYRVVRPDGSVRHADARSRALLDEVGCIEGFVGTVEDVTEAHVAQERLRELYERTPAMMHSIDTDGVILTVSDRWLEKMGYRREEVIGRRAVSLFDPVSQPVRERELVQLWDSGRNVSRVHRVLRRDGSTLNIVASAIVQHDAAGRPLRALVVSDDVTDLLARTEELRREQRERAEVEREAAQLNALLAERSEMLDVLAHEVRQPLNNASAALQSAAAALADPSSRAHAAERLRRAQGVMHAVLSGVDNTLAVSALVGGGTPAATLDDDADLDALLAVAIGDMPPHERERVRVERATDTRTASMDPGLMRLALRNLLANALHHSPPQRSVTLRISDSDEPLALVIEVIDRGPGIAPALLPHLFERGARGRDRSGRASHGLGLYIVRRALELQGGRVELATTGPEGTTMRLWLAQSR